MRKLIAAAGFALAVGLAPAASFAQIGIAVVVAPPPIPVYEQPPVPGPDYLWTPGYWSWGGSDYFWVPGSWVLAPTPGYLWTPGYWGWGDGGYFFHDGYWGPHIGFYGGINYGFGYIGVGYRGGYWDGGHFNYNRSVNNININIVHNVYNERVDDPVGARVSYNGGQGGVRAEPTSAERQAAAFPHQGPTAAQATNVTAARGNPNQFAAANHGVPGVAATARPGQFEGAGVTRASAAGGPVGREAARPGAPGAPGGAARPPASAVQNAQRAQDRVAPRPAGEAATTNRPATPVARPSAPRPTAPVARPAARPAQAERPAPAPRPAPAAPRPAPQPAAHAEAPRGGGGGHEERK